MPNSIEITKDFPATRERAVLLELLRIMRTLRNEGIDALICGGWVPFLKELARHCHTAHTMSLDIDLLLRAAARVACHCSGDLNGLATGWSRSVIIFLMCGRYRLSRRKQIIEEHFDTADWQDDWSPRYNIAPTQHIPVIRQHPKEPIRQLSSMK